MNLLDDIIDEYVPPVYKFPEQTEEQLKESEQYLIDYREALLNMKKSVSADFVQRVTEMHTTRQLYKSETKEMSLSMIFCDVDPFVVVFDQKYRALVCIRTLNAQQLHIITSMNLYMECQFTAMTKEETADLSEPLDKLLGLEFDSKVPVCHQQSHQMGATIEIDPAIYV